MKQYRVEYDPHVLKKLKKLDASVRNRITSWIGKNLVGCENPRLHGKALRGEWYGYWRYRVSDYGGTAYRGCHRLDPLLSRVPCA